MNEFNALTNVSAEGSVTIVEEQIILETSSSNGSAPDAGFITPNESQEHSVGAQPEEMDVNTCPKETGVSYNDNLLLQYELYEEELLASNNKGENVDLDGVSLGEIEDFNYINLHPSICIIVKFNPKTTFTQFG